MVFFGDLIPEPEGSKFKTTSCMEPSSRKSSDSAFASHHTSRLKIIQEVLVVVAKDGLCGCGAVRGPRGQGGSVFFLG